MIYGDKTARTQYFWCLEIPETYLGDFCRSSYTLVSQGKINKWTSHHRGWASQWESVGALVKMDVLIFDILFIQHSQSFPRAENNV